VLVWVCQILSVVPVRIGGVELGFEIFLKQIKRIGRKRLLRLGSGVGCSVGYICLLLLWLLMRLEVICRISRVRLLLLLG